MDSDHVSMSQWDNLRTSVLNSCYQQYISSSEPRIYSYKHTTGILTVHITTIRKGEYRLIGIIILFVSTSTSLCNNKINTIINLLSEPQTRPRNNPKPDRTYNPTTQPKPYATHRIRLTNIQFIPSPPPSNFNETLSSYYLLLLEDVNGRCGDVTSLYQAKSSPNENLAKLQQDQLYVAIAMSFTTTRTDSNLL
ncbi:hypothetical protein LOAG_00764 [Loa loa]|uniref:Uncharacterized protein n=1 Tax=Loa loa TaxID=7209 RepID=A0A1S0UAZ3_LOALO|nr:hypothetical protein LOAG_00764 [Loa loa]EFO27713.1 hypothetical protein LOAG_00764 [Loa loa]